jgi:hypothetical protein
VPQPLVVELDLRALHADHLSNQRGDPFHRPSELSSEDLAELVGLLVGGPRVDEDSDARQLPSVMTLGVSMITTTFWPAMSVPST